MVGATFDRRAPRISHRIALYHALTAMGVKKQDWHRLAPEREVWRNCVDDTGVRFAMAEWLQKREIRREARHGGGTVDEVGHVSCATHTETEQVGVMPDWTTRTGVEEDNEARGDPGLPRGREGVEEWAVWAIEESEEEDDDSGDETDKGDGTRVTSSSTVGGKRAETPVTEWDRERVGDVDHVVVRQPAYQTRMWSYPPRQRVQKRVEGTEKNGGGEADRTDGNAGRRGKRSCGGNSNARRNSSQGSSSSSSNSSSSGGVGNSGGNSSSCTGKSSCSVSTSNDRSRVAGRVAAGVPAAAAAAAAGISAVAAVAAPTTAAATAAEGATAAVAPATAATAGRAAVAATVAPATAAATAAGTAAVTAVAPQTADATAAGGSSSRRAKRRARQTRTHAKELHRTMPQERTDEV